MMCRNCLNLEMELDMLQGIVEDLRKQVIRLMESMEGDGK